MIMVINYFARLCQCVLLLFPLVCCAAEPLQLELDSIQPTGYLEVLTDQGDDLTLSQILASPARYQFHKLDTATPNFGYRSGVVWLRLTLRQNSSNRWLLQIRQSRLDHAELFQVVQGRVVDHQISGDQIPFSQRPFPHEQMLFPLAMNSGDTCDIYLKLQSRDSLMLPVHIWRTDAFWEANSDRNLLLGIYYGTLITMMLLSFLVWLNIFKHIYLIFCLFLGTFILVLMSLDGLASRLLWGEWVWWSKISMPLLEGLSVIFAVLFTDGFLQLKKYLPGLRLPLYGLIVPAIAVMALSLLGQYQWSIWLMTLLGLASGLMVLACGVFGLRMHSPAAPLFLFAWAIFLVGVMLFALTVLGLLPATFMTDQIMQLGAALLAIMLSLALTRQYKLMVEAISRFVPRQFLNFLKKESITDVQLGDAVLKNITVLFTDIRNFTTLSEQMTPEDNFKFLNTFLAFIEPAVGEHEGFVDKFIGDAIMALFPNGVDQAVAAALSMQKRLNNFNAELTGGGLAPISIGIGIHCGDMMLGTVGSIDRLDTTVIGDAVNLTARIEDLTKIFHATILVSGVAFHHMTHPELHCLREVDYLRPRGKKNPISIYEIFDADPEPLRLKKLQTRDSLSAALRKIANQKADEAVPILRDILDRFPEDTAAKLLLNRCLEQLET